MQEFITPRYQQRRRKQQLHIVLPDGTKLGWWDMKRQEAHPLQPHLLPALLGAVNAWQANELMERVSRMG